MTESSGERRKKTSSSSKKGASKRKRSSVSTGQEESPEFQESESQASEEEETVQEPMQQPAQPTAPQKGGIFSKFSGMFSRKKASEPPTGGQVAGDVIEVPISEVEVPSNAAAEVPSAVVPPETPIADQAVPQKTEQQSARPAVSSARTQSLDVEAKQEKQSAVLSQVPVSAQPESSENARQRAAASAPGGDTKGMPNFAMRYQIYPDNPDVSVGIVKDSETGGFRYMVMEPTMSAAERQAYTRLTRLLVDELEVDMKQLKNSKSAQPYLIREAKKVAEKYSIKLSPESYKKIVYYFNRDYLKLGKIEVLMNDPRIEDISCDGPNVPLFIWHRDYESIPTNVMFKTDEELNTFASKLAYVSGKHISIASPIVDATLPDGSRIQITYGKEVTKKGGTFTIRKFKGDPITIVDMLKYNTLSPELGAYLWYLIERRMSLLVAGGTASGKSVPYDEKVLVYRSGKASLVAIGQLYDETANAGESKREGEYEVLGLQGVETAAFDSNLKVGRFRVASVVRHATEKRIYKVHTRSGREVRTTGDHSIFSIVDGGVVPYPVSRLTPGMYVAVPRILPEPSPESHPAVDLIELFSKEDHGLYVENVVRYASEAVESLGLEGVAGILGVRSRDLKAGLKRGFVAARVSAFAALLRAAGIMPSRVDGMRIRPKTNRSRSLPTKVPVSEGLMRLLGYWTAEDMYQRGVTLFQLDENTRKDMARLSRDVLDVEIRENAGDRTRLDINSTVARALLKELFASEGGSANKRIPDVVLEQGNDLLAEFLRGYFTGDGWGRDYIEASTKSGELAQQLLYALSRFGIVAVTNQKVVRGAVYHRVLIYGQKNVAIFAEKIGFLNKYQDGLPSPASGNRVPHTNVDTIPGIGSLLKKALAFKSGPERKELWSDWHSYRSAGTTKAIGSQTLTRFLDATGAQGDIRENLLKLAYSEIFWDEVTEVEDVAYTGDYVYDLEVPGAQNFVGGAGGVFLHNTTTLNALSMFIPPDQKIVSVEDTPELNLSHKNWIQSISRGGGVAGEITLFDLLKAALRQRPDIIIVGEVRGVEAFTLFQAIASVTGDTPVLVREQGRVKLRPIGEFVDSFYSGSEERVPKHVDGCEVLSSQKNGEVVFSPVKYVLRHSAEGIYSLRYAGGALRATGSHSVFVFDDDGRVVPRRADEVTEQDILVSFCGSELPRVLPSVDVDTVLRNVPGHRVVTERPRPTCPHCASPGARMKGRVGDNRRYQCAGCNRTFTHSPGLVFTDALRGGSLISFEKSLALPKTLTVDEEFARVMGIYLADGCVKTQKGASRVVFCLGAGEKALFAEDAIRFFARFGSQPSIDDRGTYVILEFNHSPMAEVFRELCGADLSEKRVPSFMWTAPGSVVGAFLSGWEADGRRTVRDRRSVPITSARKDLIESISWLARMNSRTTYISERGSKYRSVYVSREAGENRSDSIPAAPLLRLKEMLGSGAWLHMPKRTSKTISKSRAEKALQEVIITARKEMSWEAAQLVSTLSALIEGSLIATRILSIERQPFQGYVYDVSVPWTEAFFGGESPVALHNTGHGGLGTIHADSVEAAINRITSEPMNVPKSLLGSTLDCLVMQLRIKLKDRSVRRMVHVAEIVGHEAASDQIVLNNAFKWDPVSDQYIFSGRSRLFEKITKRFGTPPEKIRQDLEDRRIFLKWLMTKNIRDYRDVSQQIREFYSDKETVIERAMRGLDEAQ